MSNRHALLSLNSSPLVLIPLLFLLSCLLLPFVQANSNDQCYDRGEQIPLYYNKLFSQRNQLPHRYASQPFICPPYTDDDWSHKSRLSNWLVVDQDWRGDWLVKSDYKISTLDNVDCNVLCTKTWSIEDAMVAKQLILDGYQVEWWLDDLPGATASYTNEVNTRAYRVGFPLGQIKNNQAFFNNHVIFNILYAPCETTATDRIQIVGFEVYPDSVANGQCTHTSIDYTMQEVTERRKSVTFTYSIKWKEVKQLPAQRRWDTYLIAPNPDTHFYAMINSFITVLFLLGVVSVILMKTLRKDQLVHEDSDYRIYDDFEDVVGWRLIHRDVFRRPMYGGLLAPLVGSGMQLLLSFAATIVCIANGYCHPAKPGAILNFAATAYIWTSAVAGYYSARIYKVFRGRSWFLNTVLTSILVPGSIFTCLMIESFFAWSLRSSRAISVKGWLVLTLLWFLVSMPLTFLGAFIGDRRERIEHPARVTQMPRFIPDKRWYQTYSVSIAVGGVIPFAVVFVDYDELLKSLWHGEIHLFTLYAVTACALLAIATASVSVVLVFFQLCNEDYHWWWMSFAVGGASSLYMFVYAVVFYWIRTDIQGVVSGVVYIVHTLMGCGLLGLATGTLGFFCTYSVIRRIYSAVKVD
ncbi:Endomembrane protein 70-domain-containing protein [Zychaea mexicana]|uniref:Endomembrane protein 70-domain-containing protein n=1 Tax=Zychaea mexicana TaxID=64656 RepID=UPI0022FEAACE|nr:Endomembrane protein 70-domain-containing protein [Zychaea mexicana]KAI9495121.1 Endomembrane protein 70-domain-containing protein [Zychaea mexicana]